MTNATQKLLQRDFPLSAFALALTATLLVLAEGICWAVMQSTFTPQFNAEDMLFHFGPAALMATCTLLLLRHPVHNKLCAVGIGFGALLSLLSGGGFLAGLTLGVTAAILCAAWNSNRRIYRSITGQLTKMGKKNRAYVLLTVAVIVVPVAMPTEIGYQTAINTDVQNLQSESKVIHTAHGQIEYAETGEGTPILVSHGAGMGYMQIGSIQAMLGNSSFRIIVPSRPGYLRTPMRQDSSFAAQADQFADLLDALNISKAVIMGVSIGGPAALEFALRYPDRCSALIMASAISHNTPAFDAMGEIMHQIVFRSDFSFYTLATNYQPMLLQFLGVTATVQANMTAADKAYVSEMINAMTPISLRQDGLINDAARSQTELDLNLTQIQMPTLVFHCKDDGLVNYEFGQFTVSHIPDAEFVSFENGGHLLVGHQQDIHDHTVSFLKENQIIP